MCKPVFDKSVKLKDNAMLKYRPELFYEWDFEKNDELGLSVYEVTKGQNVKASWICLACSSNFDMIVKSRISQNCPYCAGQKVNHTNSLAMLRPDLVVEWHPQLNEDRSPHDFTSKSEKVVWWKCSECDSDYNMSIKQRARTPKNSVCCPYGHGKRVNHTNSLAAIKPDIAKEWHTTKNKEYTPHDFTYGSYEKAWWIGDCGHEWEARISTRSKGHGCPFCENKKVLKGYNDMWTTNPDLAGLLMNSGDGYKYTENSGKKVDWKCLNCKEIIRDKKIQDIGNRGLSCPVCSDGKPYPEKFMYYVLKQIGVDFRFDTTLDWSLGRRYDFYLPSYNTIIETHGGQHYIQQGRYRRNLEEEQENDRIKESVARANGIENYIIIDSSKSNMQHMRDSILTSKLSNMFNLDNINWTETEKKSMSSWVIKVCEIWNETKSVARIKDELKLSDSTVNKYLHKGNALGICDYNGIKRRVVQLSLTGEYICNWNSITEAANNTGVKDITKCCKGKLKTAGGFKWMYKEDYEKSNISKLL